jgi:poly(A) polymerase
VHGVFSGVYDPAAPGKVRWDRRPEIRPLPVRPLAIVEANGALFFSADKTIYRRIDGPAPRWEVVHALDDLASGKTLSPVGGIRGLTPIDNASGGQSLLFIWEPDGRSRACVMRLDPSPAGFVRTEEVCLDRLVSTYLGGTPAPFVLAGYNNFLSVDDRGRTQHLVGLEAWVGGTRWRTVQGKDAKGGYYAGALYAIRESASRYRLAEVNGRIDAGNPALESTRAYVLSPFDVDAGRVVYMAGFDCNFVRCADTAWIFRADLATVVGLAP